jgi:hypothetical protein
LNSADKLVQGDVDRHDFHRSGIKKASRGTITLRAPFVFNRNGSSNRAYISIEIFILKEVMYKAAK